MSFLRFLLALVVVGGIGYGLFALTMKDRVVQQNAGGGSSVSVAERAPVAEPEATPEAESTPSFTERTGEAVAALSENVESAVDQAAESISEFVEPVLGSGSQEASDEADNAATDEPEVAEPSLADRAGDAVAALSDNVENAVGGAVESITELVEPVLESGADEPPAEAEAQAGTTLPSAASEVSASGSVNALKVVSGGMAYSEARKTMIEAGWTPRVIDSASRIGKLYASEEGLLEAGYDELEGCSGGERAICRFEFIDGNSQIAAVITAGSDGDPLVIDAFLMDIGKTR